LFKRRKPEGPLGNEASPGGPSAGLLGDEATAEQSRARTADRGLGVPPYRPAPSKEAPDMGRAPFSPPNFTNGSSPGNPALGNPASGNPGLDNPGLGGPAPTPIGPPRPGAQLGVQPGRMHEPAERRTLVVGRGISLQGTVSDAERLVVEGTIEATMIHAAELAIAQGGVFKGEIEVEDAEIAGVIDGTLTVRGNLIVRATGKVLGAARCRRLQVEDGGQITGRVEMLTEGASKPEAARPAEVSA